MLGVAVDAYDRFTGRYAEPLAPGFADFAGVVAGQRALDVGCGPGAVTAELVRRVGPDAICEDRPVAEGLVRVRATRDEDRLPLARLFAAVAAERDRIGTEPPVDVEARAATWELDGDFLAEADGQVIGSIHVQASRHGYGELGMAVAREWRGRGVGSALMLAAIDWARSRGLHKLSLSVFPHNEAAIALYRKFGFVEEGRRVKHYRRASGEVWDAIEMGLLL